MLPVCLYICLCKSCGIIGFLLILTVLNSTYYDSTIWPKCWNIFPPWCAAGQNCAVTGQQTLRGSPCWGAGERLMWKCVQATNMVNMGYLFLFSAIFIVSTFQLQRKHTFYDFKICVIFLYSRQLNDGPLFNWCQPLFSKRFINWYSLISLLPVI